MNQAIIIGVIASLVWALLLFQVGSSKRKLDWLFLILILAPVAVSLYFAYGLIHPAIFIAIVIERIIWAFSAKHAANEDKATTFIAIFYLSPIAWITYWSTKYY